MTLPREILLLLLLAWVVMSLKAAFKKKVCPTVGGGYLMVSPLPFSVESTLYWNVALEGITAKAKSKKNKNFRGKRQT